MEWIELKKIEEILVSSTIGVIKTLYNTNTFDVNDDNLISKESVYEYIDKRVDHKYMSLSKAKKKLSLNSYDYSILKRLKNPENPFFCVNIEGQEKCWIRINQLNKMIENPFDYRFIKTKELATQIGLKSTSKLIHSYKKGVLKTGFYSDNKLVFPLRLSHEIKNGYTLPVLNHSLIKVRKLAKDNNIPYDNLVGAVKKGFYSYYFQEHKIIDGISTPRTYYIYEKEFNEKLELFNKKHNKRSWKIIKLINASFKKQIKKRYILRIDDRFYIRYILKGIVYLERTENIRGEILIPIKKNPFPDEEQIFLSEIALDKLKITKRYDYTDIEYLSIKMLMAADQHFRRPIIDAKTPSDMKKIEVMLKNHEIYLGTRHRRLKESIIIGFENKMGAMSITSGLSMSNLRISLEREQLLPVLMIHVNVKFRKSDRIKINYNRNTNHLKAEIDNIIYLLPDFEPNPYGTKMKSLIEDCLTFLKKGKGRNIIIGQKFENIIKNADVISEGERIIWTYKNIAKRILITFNENGKNLKILYNTFSEELFDKDLKIIPYYIFEAIIKRKTMSKSLYEFSSKILDKTDEIKLYIDWGKYTIIRARDVYKIYSLRTLDRPIFSSIDKRVGLYLDLLTEKKDSV